MSEESRARIWEEMVESSKRREEKVVLRVVKRDWSKEKVVLRVVKRDWRKELMSDLWLLVILEVVGCGLLCIVELLKY